MNANCSKSLSDCPNTDAGIRSRMGDLEILLLGDTATVEQEQEYVGSKILFEVCKGPTPWMVERGFGWPRCKNS